MSDPAEIDIDSVIDRLLEGIIQLLFISLGLWLGY
jgi:hypothetical protein